MNMKDGMGYKYNRNGKVYQEEWKENQLVNKTLLQEKQEAKQKRRTHAQRMLHKKRKLQHLAKLKCKNMRSQY